MYSVPAELLENKGPGLDSKRTYFEAVQADKETPEEWLAGQPVCSILQNYRIAHIGTLRAAKPFRALGSHGSGTLLLACLSGLGHVKAGEERIRLRAGEACLIPRSVKSMLRCEEGNSWDFAWVKFAEPRDTAPLHSGSKPIRGKFPVSQLRRTIRGLRADALSGGNAASMQLWVTLIRGYVSRFSRHSRTDGRLARVWNAVKQHPGQAWSLPDLAATACMSEEHLRRLCKKEYGRSPIQQLTFIRMQYAGHLLATTSDKIEAIAREVGYQNAFTFSAAFKKWFGWCPSEHRLAYMANPGSNDQQS